MAHCLRCGDERSIWTTGGMSRVKCPDCGVPKMPSILVEELKKTKLPHKEVKSGKSSKDYI